jgi:8-oxo-dGTP diphosphatase
LREGTSIIFVNDREQILLLLRDDCDKIPYPNMWDVPGGHVEAGESARQCIIREMQEELGLKLKAFDHFCTITFYDRIEHTFWQKANLNIDDIELNEGQRLRWFDADETARTRLAYGFNRIVKRFFAERPFAVQRPL